MNKYAMEMRTVYYDIEDAMNAVRRENLDQQKMVQEAFDRDNQEAKMMAAHIIRIDMEIKENEKHFQQGGFDLDRVVELRHERALTLLRLNDELTRVEFKEI